MKNKLKLVIVLLGVFFVFNGLQHPVINMAFSDEELTEIPIYSEWKINNKDMYSNIKQAHTKHIIKKNEEIDELKEDNEDFIKEIKVDKRTVLKIDSLETFEIMMKNYEKKDIEKAFNMIEKYDRLEQKLQEKKVFHKDLLTGSVSSAIFLAVVVWFM